MNNMELIGFVARAFAAAGDAQRSLTYAFSSPKRGKANGHPLCYQDALDWLDSVDLGEEDGVGKLRHDQLMNLISSLLRVRTWLNMTIADLRVVLHKTTQERKAKGLKVAGWPRVYGDEEDEEDEDETATAAEGAAEDESIPN